VTQLRAITILGPVYTALFCNTRNDGRSIAKLATALYTSSTHQTMITRVSAWRDVHHYSLLGKNGADFRVKQCSVNTALDYGRLIQSWWACGHRFTIGFLSEFQVSCPWTAEIGVS